VIRKSIFVILFCCLVFISGCSSGFDPQGSKTDSGKEELLRVKIVFQDGSTVTGYVKTLGVDARDRVLVGGASIDHIYDVNGKIIGCYNYQHVSYMMILSSSEITE